MGGLTDRRFLICILLLKLGSCAPNLPTGVSSGEQVLVITTTDAAATEAVAVTEVPSSSGESWEMDNNDLNLSVRQDETHPLPASQKESVPPTIAKTKSTKPEIYSFRIQSDIKYRYSKTSITSRVANRDVNKSQEVTFRVVLPETAFISKFIMEIDGKAYEAYVKEKEEAKKVYNEAQSQGQSAGLVEVNTRNSNTFNVNVNIKSQSKVTFNLTYEELLTRRLGKYEQVINIIPEQVSSVKDFQIVVNIEESQNITFLRVPNLRNDVESTSDAEGNIKDAVILKSGNKANISWSPSLEDQEKLSHQGVGGKFVVSYDIDRNSTSGEVLIMEGYFVHFFAPETLKPLRKHVVFVLDVSGSMWGRKLQQLKDSQTKILDDLNADDFFNIITFSGDVFLWSPNHTIAKQSFFLGRSPPQDSTTKEEPNPATKENIEKAKAFIESLVASGGTNIHDSIIKAIQLTSTIKNARDGTFSIDEPSVELPEPLSMMDIVKMTNSSDVVNFTSTTTTTPKPVTRILPATILPKNVESLIIFLTDGEPTVGVTDPPYIRKLIQSANKNLTLPIFSLGFGEGADFQFLRKLSLQNFGFARKIYEASDAALQLKGFYNEIASPLLAHVLFNYTSPEYNVTELTVTSFPTVFGGTEVAVAGRLVPLAQTATPEFNNGVEEVTDGTIIRDLSMAEEDITTASVVLDDAPPDYTAFILSDKHLLDVGISGNGRDGNVKFTPPLIFCHQIDYDILRPFPPRPTPPPTQEDKFLERLWAYLTIQQLIERDLKEGDMKNNEISDDDDNFLQSFPSGVEPESQTVSTFLPLNKTLTGKPETAKQQAIRLALKYGFVTPFTSLVVVKPNSSDVTNALLSADAPTDTSDSISAPQSMSFLAIAQPPVPMSIQAPPGWGNRIGSSPSYGSPGMNQPLYLSIRRPMPASASAGFSQTGHAFTTRRQRPRPTSTTSTSYNLMSTSVQTNYETQSAEEESDTDGFAISSGEETTQKSLTLADIKWFNSSHPSLRVNESDYTISSNKTDSNFVGSECSNLNEGAAGQCVHLRDCIQQEFVSDLELFKTSYFCPIQAISGISYVGVCCSSGGQYTTATPFMLP